MSSTYYLGQKNKYEIVKSKIQGVFTYFDSCEVVINRASLHLQNLILDDKPFDDGKLNIELSRLAKVRENLQIIIDECSNKIVEYNNLYRNALAEERLETEKHKTVNSEKTVVKNSRFNLLK